MEPPPALWPLIACSTVSTKTCGVTAASASDSAWRTSSERLWTNTVFLTRSCLWSHTCLSHRDGCLDWGGCLNRCYCGAYQSPQDPAEDVGIADGPPSTGGTTIVSCSCSGSWYMESNGLLRHDHHGQLEQGGLTGQVEVGVMRLHRHCTDPGPRISQR